MSEADATLRPAEVGVSIGVAAARVGVTTSTLRSWGTRYGVVPSLRSAGGHRRYSEADLQVLDRLQAAVHAGSAPAAAAALALTEATSHSEHVSPGPRSDSSTPPRRGAGPGGRVLGVPGADPQTRGLARAVSQLDVEGAEELMVAALRERGVVRTWDEMMRPVLAAAGRRWAETGTGVEIEHVLSEAAVGALRRRRVELPEPPVEPPVLLAAAPGDQHTLALQALAVGLAERGRRSRVIGAQVPLDALATAVRRTRPSAVFVSCVVSSGADPHALLAALPRTRPAIPVVIGGGGWPQDIPPGLVMAADLARAIDLLTAPV